MFPAVEAFFGGGGQGDAVDHQRSGGVVTLRDSIFTLLQTRPVRLFEGHGLFQAANSQDVHND